MWPFSRARDTVRPDPGDVLLHEMRELRQALANYGDLLVQTMAQLTRATHVIAETRAIVESQRGHMTHLQARVEQLEADAAQ